MTGSHTPRHRARKFTQTFPWEAHMPRIFTYLLSTFHIPFGSGDAPATRDFPARYRFLLQPQPQHYQRLRLLAKLAAFLLGR
jgi:hypothetical protein